VKSWKAEDERLDRAVERGGSAAAPQERAADPDFGPGLVSGVGRGERPQVGVYNCAEKQQEAIAVAEAVLPKLPAERQLAFRLFVDELREFRWRILAFAYHCRETNLAYVLRRALVADQPAPEHVVEELLEVMEADRANMVSDDLEPALELLRSDPLEFANTYFLPSSLLQSRGDNSVTSR
jgi:hypothetical protein